MVGQLRGENVLIRICLRHNRFGDGKNISMRKIEILIELLDGQQLHRFAAPHKFAPPSFIH
jgi:hypothetical protein